MRRLYLAFFGLIFGISLLTTSGMVDSTDGLQYLDVARNLFYKGKPVATPYGYGVVDIWGESQNIHLGVSKATDGNYYSTGTGLGYSLALMPAVWFSDTIHFFAKVQPDSPFPIAADWPVQLFATWTNPFFGALTALIILLWLRSLRVPLPYALIGSLTTFFTTSLFTMSKYTFAHIMFTAFLTLTFYATQKAIRKKEIASALTASAAFGMVTITYNSTFWLSVPALCVYGYFLFRESGEKIALTKRVVYFILAGLLPWLLFFIANMGFNSLKVDSAAADLIAVAHQGVELTTGKFLPSLTYEALWGIFFSAGKSLFLFIPPLIVLLIFWHRIPKKVLPELVAFVVLLCTYVATYSTFGSGLPEGYEILWHGENSYGPRYFTPIIPLAGIVFSTLLPELKKWHKWLVFGVCMMGLWIQIIGILLPYQVKGFNMQYQLQVNVRMYNFLTYPNWFPHISPPFTMSKELAKRLRDAWRNRAAVPYDFTFFDGVSPAEQFGPYRVRHIEKNGYAQFIITELKPKQVSLDLWHYEYRATDSAQTTATLQFFVNDQKISTLADFSLGEKRTHTFEIPQELLVVGENILHIATDLPATPTNGGNDVQVILVTGVKIDNEAVSIEKMSIPYVSSLGPPLTGTQYRTWGGENPSRWRTWQLRQRAYQNSPFDIWWVRTFVFWDVPARFLASLAVVIALCTAVCGYIVYRENRKRLLEW